MLEKELGYEEQRPRLKGWTYKFFPEVADINFTMNLAQ